MAVVARNCTKHCDVKPWCNNVGTPSNCRDYIVECDRCGQPTEQLFQYQAAALGHAQTDNLSLNQTLCNHSKIMCKECTLRWIQYNRIATLYLLNIDFGNILYSEQELFEMLCNQNYLANVYQIEVGKYLKEQQALAYRVQTDKKQITSTI